MKKYNSSYVQSLHHPAITPAPFALTPQNPKKKKVKSLDEKQKENWEKIRAKGKQRYIWLRWILGRIIPVAMILIVWNAISSFLAWGLPFGLSGGLIFLVIAGYGLALWRWNKNENKYSNK